MYRVLVIGFIQVVGQRVEKGIPKGLYREKELPENRRLELREWACELKASAL